MHPVDIRPASQALVLALVKIWTAESTHTLKSKWFKMTDDLYHQQYTAGIIT